MVWWTGKPNHSREAAPWRDHLKRGVELWRWQLVESRRKRRRRGSIGCFDSFALLCARTLARAVYRAKQADKRAQPRPPRHTNQKRRDARSAPRPLGHSQICSRFPRSSEISQILERFCKPPAQASFTTMLAGSGSHAGAVSGSAGSLEHVSRCEARGAPLWPGCQAVSLLSRRSSWSGASTTLPALQARGQGATS